MEYNRYEELVDRFSPGARIVYASEELYDLEGYDISPFTKAAYIPRYDVVILFDTSADWAPLEENDNATYIKEVVVLHELAHRNVKVSGMDHGPEWQTEYARILALYFFPDGTAIDAEKAGITAFVQDQSTGYTDKDDKGV